MRYSVTCMNVDLDTRGENASDSRKTNRRMSASRTLTHFAHNVGESYKPRDESQFLSLILCSVYSIQGVGCCPSRIIV